MAWILRNSGNEKRYGKLERVASQKNTNVYLEAVEAAENEGRKPKEIRNEHTETETLEKAIGLLQVAEY